MSDCCIYEPQNYDLQAVDRFLRGETREICIELKCVEREKSEDFAITDAVLQRFNNVWGAAHVQRFRSWYPLF